MKRIVVAGLAVLVSATGCATKNYGRQGELTSYEMSTLSCREIDLETARVHGFLSHVDKESQFDGRSVLSFLGDFGVGNVMEKSNAVDSATTRLAQLQDLRTRRRCGAVAAAPETRPGIPGANVVAAATPDLASTSEPKPPTQFGRYTYAAENLPDVRSCNPYPIAKLSAQGPGFEKYTVVCTDGDALSLRCEGGGCRVLK